MREIPECFQNRLKVLDENVHLGILDSSNSPGSQDQLLPGLLQVDDVDAVGLLLEDVLLHRRLAVVRADVGGRSQHLGNVILLEIMDIDFSRAQLFPLLNGGFTQV